MSVLVPSPTGDVPVNVGDLIAGKYRVERVLGQGGMGVVLAATHLDLDRRVAVKIVRPEHSQSPELVARMLQEARSAAQIRSEHVCAVLDVGRLDSGAPYIVMEYLEGMDVGTLLQQSVRVSMFDAVEYVLQACEALAEAHAASIIHRDLKPENLFLARRADGSTFVKVLDFGISKNTSGSTKGTPSALTNASSAVGSPHYMSPEQMKSSRDVDPRTDLWALGAILYELTSGRPPFDGDTIPAVCAAVMHSEPAPLRSHRPDLPVEFEAVVMRCLQKDREQRFADVSQLADALVPFGAAQSALSAQRISRVLGGSVSALGATLLSTSIPRVASSPVPVAQTPVTLPGIAKRSKAPLVVGVALGVALAAGLVLTLTRSRATADAEAVPPAPKATAAAVPAGPASAPVPQIDPAPVAAADPAPGASASAAPAASAARPAAKPRSGGAARPSAPNAFDPGSFGGRR